VNEKKKKKKKKKKKGKREGGCGTLRLQLGGGRRG
jgi:hypothetical protein